MGFVLGLAEKGGVAVEHQELDDERFGKASVRDREGRIDLERFAKAADRAQEVL